MAYSFAQLEGLWEQAGGSPKLAPVMAAIALAESSGNPNATGGVGERGLWQINPHVWGSLATYDPLGNARAAVHVLSVQGLTAWSTFNNGRYKHFLGSAKPVTGGSSGAAGAAAGAGAAGSGGSGGGGGGGAGLQGFFAGLWASLFGGGAPNIGGLSDVAQGIAALTLPFTKFAQALDWFFVPSHWIRIFAGLGGGVLTIGGIWTLAHSGEDRPSALPVGIALTGGGAVLLFVAFHNLDPNITTVGELLADLQGKAQAGASATVSPAAAVKAAAVTAAGG